MPTKHHPSIRTDAFFADSDLPQVRPFIHAELRRLEAHLDAGGTVAIPTSGIGTKRAQLAERAPTIRLFIDDCFAHLERLAQNYNRAAD